MKDLSFEEMEMIQGGDISEVRPRYTSTEHYQLCTDLFGLVHAYTVLMFSESYAGHTAEAEAAQSLAQDVLFQLEVHNCP